MGRCDPFHDANGRAKQNHNLPLLAILSPSRLAILAALWERGRALAPDAHFDGAGEGTSLTDALGAAGVPTLGSVAEVAGAAEDAGAELALATGSAAPFFDHTTRPKREAL